MASLNFELNSTHDKVNTFQYTKTPQSQGFCVLKED